MKSFQVAVVLLLACAAIVHAEPPRFRSNRFQFQRQEQDPVEPPQEEGSGAEGPYPASAPYPPAMAAPYPPSNWKPSGRLFALPARQTQTPTTIYGPPPPQAYGPPPTEQPAEPEQTTTVAPEEETTDESVTTEPLSENVDVDDKAQEQQPQQPQSERLTQGGPGFYYVQLPSLQQPNVQQQQIYLAPQVQSAQLKVLPSASVAQPLVLGSQPLVYSTGYYVSSQSW